MCVTIYHIHYKRKNQFTWDKNTDGRSYILFFPHHLDHPILPQRNVLIYISSYLGPFIWAYDHIGTPKIKRDMKNLEKKGFSFVALSPLQLPCQKYSIFLLSSPGSNTIISFLPWLMCPKENTSPYSLAHSLCWGSFLNDEVSTRGLAMQEQSLFTQSQRTLTTEMNQSFFWTECIHIFQTSL